jgi:hypothetical protein
MFAILRQRLALRQEKSDNEGTKNKRPSRTRGEGKIMTLEQALAEIERKNECFRLTRIAFGRGRLPKGKSETQGN